MFEDELRLALERAEAALVVRESDLRDAQAQEAIALAAARWLPEVAETRPSLLGADARWVDEIRSYGSVGSPPPVAKIVMQVAAGLLEALAGGRRDAALMILEGRGRWDSVQRRIARDDLADALSRGCCGRADIASVISSLAVAAESRLAAGGVSAERAQWASEAVGALRRWCLDIILDAATCECVTDAPTDLPLDESHRHWVEHCVASLIAAEDEVKMLRTRLEACARAELPEAPVAQGRGPRAQELKEVAAGGPQQSQPSQQSHQQQPYVAPAFAPVEVVATEEQSSSDGEGDEAVIEKPVAMLRQCVQFRRGDVEVSEDQVTVLRSAAMVIKMKNDLEVAVVGLREASEDLNLDLKRAEAIQAALGRLGGIDVARRVRCIAGGSEAARTARRAELRVVQCFHLPVPLQFATGSSELPLESRFAMKAVSRHLKKMPALRLYIDGGHDEDEPPALALSRAKAMQSALLQRKGIDATRVHSGESSMAGRFVELRVVELPCTAFVASQCGPSFNLPFLNNRDRS